MAWSVREASDGPLNPKDVYGFEYAQAPSWLSLLTLELSDSLEDPVDSYRFRSQIATSARSRGALDGVEHHFVLRRINSQFQGVRPALARALGERHDYVLAYQQLNYALSLSLNGSDYGARQVAVAVETLKRSAPAYDRALLATGAPLSFVVTCVAGWWNECVDENAPRHNGDPWHNAHAAARADLLAVLTERMTASA